MASVVAAMIGLSVLLLSGVLEWDDCLSEKQAWDTLAWFGALVGMATQLTALGVIPWISNCVAHFLKSLSLSWIGAFTILQLSYFFIHYLFASQTAHVGALYSAFLGMQLASNVPPLLAALVLAYNTNLFGAITHYSSGQAAIYYGGMHQDHMLLFHFSLRKNPPCFGVAAGYVDLREVFLLGIAMGVLQLAIWGLFGAAWWKILGLY